VEGRPYLFYLNFRERVRRGREIKKDPERERERKREEERER